MFGTPITFSRRDILCLGSSLFVGYIHATSRPAMGQEPVSPPSGPAPAGLARTVEIMDAAGSFLDGLSRDQREEILLPFSDPTRRTGWSNLPEGLFERNGLRWGDLAGHQRATLRTLLGVILSPKGARLVDEQLAGDDILASQGGPRAIADRFHGIKRGRDYYYTAFFGEPSATRPWMFRFGGHHLAINATIAGPRATLSPLLTGGHPVRFVMNGRKVNMVGEEVVQAQGLFNALTEKQRGRAWIETRRADLVAGPGRDDGIPPRQGLPGRDMDAAQRARLLALITARLEILNADHLAPELAALDADLNQTYFAWFGPRPDDGAAYWRVSGPRILMEFSPQSMGGDPSNHLHNIYRDPTNDYGMAWLSGDHRQVMGPD